MEYILSNMMGDKNYIQSERLETNKFVLVDTLSQEQLEHLRDRIKDWNGTIRVFVHPHYLSKYPRSYRFETGHVTHALPGKYLNMLATKQESKTPPIFIFEEYASVNDLMETMHAPAQPLYIIRTAEQESRMIPEINLNESNLLAKLKDLGVTRVVIGGEILNYTGFHEDNSGNIDVPRSLRNNGVEVPYFTGCVAGVMDLLRDSDITIQVSNFTYPWPHNQRANKT